jgi:hypothetical protein
MNKEVRMPELWWGLAVVHLTGSDPTLSHLHHQEPRLTPRSAERRYKTLSMDDISMVWN